MKKWVFAALLAGAISAPAIAQGLAVSLQSSVFVERLGYSRDGRVERTIEPAGKLARGDRIVLVVEWKGGPSANGFTVTSPIPRTIAFEDASDEAALVSVDGGKTFGALGALKLTDRYGTRLASPEDVTHLRWKVSSGEAQRGKGRKTYSAIVR